MKNQLTLSEARERQMIPGLTTEGFKIVQRSLEARLIDALRDTSVFALHMGYDLLINMESETSAIAFSTRDQNRYRVTFELDAFDEPRVIKIIPLGRLAANQEVIREQVNQKMAAGLPITEQEFSQLKKLDERDEKASAQKMELQQLQEQRIAGLISHEKYFEKRDQLLVEQAKEKNGGKKLLFEDGDDGPTKRKKLWEARDRGEISLDECLNRTAAIRVAEERAARPRWLTESQESHDPCGCRDCTLAEFKVHLDARVDDGTITREKADQCYAIRCELD
jgi:hypothetical protein